MKKFLLLLLIHLSCIISFSQIIVEEPKFSATTAPYVKITKIELHDTVTIMDFEVTFKPKWWIQVLEDQTYIQDSKGSEKWYATGAKGIKLNEKHYTPETGKNIYTLYFPPLDPSIKTIDYLEEQWKIFDIELQPQEHYSIIPEPLKGNWLRTDGSNEWVVGFYDNMVIYKNECWDKILISSKKKQYKVSLRKDGKHEVIHIKLSKNDNLLVGADPGNLELLSREKTVDPGFRIKDDTAFSVPVFKEGKAVYKGYIHGYHPKMESTGIVYVNNIVTQNQDSYLITIDPEGTFEIEFPMIYPQEVYVRMLGISESVFLQPGKSTFHYINLQQYNDQSSSPTGTQELKTLYMGDCARINTDLQMMGHINYFNYREVQKKILDMSIEEYKAHFLNIMEKEQADLEKFASNHAVSKKAIQVMQFKIPYNCYRNILSYKFTMSSAYRKKHNIPREQREIPLEIAQPGPGYYDFIDPSELNNPLSVIAGSAYSSLINRVRFADCVRPGPNYFYVSIMDAIRKNEIEITGQQRTMLGRLIDCETNDCIKEILRNDTVTLASFFREHPELVDSVRRNDYKDFQRANWNKYFGLADGFATDIFEAQYTCNRMKGRNKPLSGEDKEEIRNQVSNDFIVSYLMQYSQNLEDEIARKMEENKHKTGYVVNATPDTEGDKLFDAIMQKYKGKVVFVDFWATWCSPCRSGIERMKPLKEELKDKDIAFVYITNPTSPTDTWNMMVPDVKGEHYRVTQDEWNHFASKFNISGIPHYMLVDRDGTVVRDKLYFASSNRELKSLLEEYLNE